jgi:hypothetical protein
MRFDFSNVDEVQSYVSIPPGRHPCRVTEVRPGSARDGSARWTFRLEVVGGVHHGRTAAWDSLTWSDRGVARVRHVLKGLGVPTQGVVEIEPQDLVGRRALVQIQLEERENPQTGRREMRTRVPYAGYDPIESGDSAADLDQESSESSPQPDPFGESRAELLDRAHAGPWSDGAARQTHGGTGAAPRRLALGDVQPSDSPGAGPETQELTPVEVESSHADESAASFERMLGRAYADPNARDLGLRTQLVSESSCAADPACGLGWGAVSSSEGAGADSGSSVESGLDGDGHADSGDRTDRSLDSSEVGFGWSVEPTACAPAADDPPEGDSAAGGARGSNARGSGVSVHDGAGHDGTGHDGTRPDTRRLDGSGRGNSADHGAGAEGGPTPLKRRPGRPRKHPLPADQSESSRSSPQPSAEGDKRRGRRPKDQGKA